MRRFNLKGKVVQRMMGIEDDRESKGKKSPAGKEQEQESAAASPADEKTFAPEGTRLAWRTDTGRIRRNNQDAVILGYGLIGVADGMGGHNGGEIASAGLRDGLLRELKDKQPDLDVLAEAVRKINLELWQQQEQDAALTGMGTTLTILWPAETEMIIGQVGDSRAYLIRNGGMTQVTNDHSMVADMVRKGVLTEEQAACHPMRNYITRAVGTEDTIEVDMQTVPRATGDRWLVCSDGLYGQISKSELQELMSITDLEEAADRLLQAALENGGKDNISFVLLQDDKENEAPAAETAEDAGAENEPDGGQPEAGNENAEETEKDQAEDSQEDPQHSPGEGAVQ